MSEYTKNLNLFKYDTISDAKQPFDIQKALNENWDKIDQQSSTMPVGTIFIHTASTGFVPENSLPCDGTEYSSELFPTLYEQWLISNKLDVCTYTEYDSEVQTSGQCFRWAVDETNKKFKVPKIQNRILDITKPIPIKGNGKTLGLTDGVSNAGLSNQAGAQNWVSLFAKLEGYDTDIRTPISVQNGNILNPNSTVGVTSDSTKSGIETDPDNIAYKTIKYFVIVATKSINQSEIDWSQYITSLEGKANTDLSNVNFSQDFINKCMNWVIPDPSTRVTVEASFTTPYDCYIYTTSASPGAYNTITVDGISILSCQVPREYHGRSYYLPCYKGASVVTGGMNGWFIDKLKGVEND